MDINLEIVDNQAYVSHRTVAKEIFEFDSRKKADKPTQLKNKTTQIKELITDNLADFEEFGRVRFETESDLDVKEKQKFNSNYRAEKTYFLNEPQATLLLTFLRNSIKIKRFKVLLVKEFFKMREIIQSGAVSIPTANENLISVTEPELDKELKALKFVLDNFNLSEAEKISYTNIFFERTNIPTLKNPHLKKHEQVFTLTDLLKDFQIQILTKDFNLKLQSFGIVKRLGSGWILVDMKFGENRDFREGKNHRYYKSTFQELLDIVLEEKS